LKNNVSLICTETGSIKYIDINSRNNYFRDALDVMYEFGIPALIWDLDQTFDISHSNNKSVTVPIQSVLEFINKIK